MSQGWFVGSRLAFGGPAERTEKNEVASSGVVSSGVASSGVETRSLLPNSATVRRCRILTG